MTTPEGARFSRLWELYAHRVMAYASRHVDPDSVQDVVSETFLVAWRRLVDVPGDPLPWLLVVARNTISNRRRSAYRARVMELELVRIARVARPADGADVPVIVYAEVIQELGALTATEREAVLLTAWDGLDAAAGAQVAGCSVDAFTKRLSRARARLSSQHLEDDDEPRVRSLR